MLDLPWTYSMLNRMMDWSREQEELITLRKLGEDESLERLKMERVCGCSLHALCASPFLDSR